jgi:class 3 adenylate cyclase
MPSAAALCAHVSPLSYLFPQHANVSVLFADIVGFTTLSKEVPPEAVMAMLHRLFSRFDHLSERMGVYKVEAIGEGGTAAAASYRS